MKILIATGGTGGHIFTAFEIADEFISRKIEILLVGSKLGLEKKLMLGKYRFKFTSQHPFLGKKLKTKIMFPFFSLIALIQAVSILLKERPDGVIGTGGFGSFSCVFVAAILGIPTLITEIDSIPGLTTKVLANFVYAISTAFPSAKNNLPAKKVKISGFPVRKEITKCTKKITEYGLEENKYTVLVFGGSRGAQAINKIIPEVKKLLQNEFQFIWQTGDSRITAEHKNKNNIYVADFIDDMGSAYGNSHLVVSRAGALTIGEIMTTGIPAILIPFPYATKQHQMINAKWLEKQGLAKVIPEEKLTPEKLANEIKIQLQNGKKSRKQKYCDAAKLIADRMINIINRNRGASLEMPSGLVSHKLASPGLKNRRNQLCLDI